MILITCTAAAAIALTLLTVIIRNRIAAAYTCGYRHAELDLDDLRGEVHDLELRINAMASAVHPLPGGAL